ncbi:MAG: PAS domain S-box protein, partial [Chitinophagaceae bacterium]
HAGSFKQAAEIFTAKEFFCDAVLLDLSLPDKNGLQLIEEILALVKSCPIIILTGNGDIEFSIKSIALGITDYLIKDDLTATILYRSILYAIERKKSSLRLKESEKRYSDIFYLSPQPMWVYEVNSLIFSRINVAATELYGYSESEFLSMSIMDLLQEEEMEGAKFFIDKGILNVTQKGEFRHVTKSGKLIEVETYSTPIKIDGKNVRTVIAIDVTEKNLLEHNVTKAIIKTQEDERYEIGAELHDNVCQLLATTKLGLNMIEHSIAPADMRWFVPCDDCVGMALDEIRNLSHRLAPAFFDNTTLETAFNKLLNAFNAEDEYKIVLHFSEAAKQYPISQEIQLCLYRILQEQLKNIHKYARTTVIEVDVLLYRNKLKMRISDNGIGFDPETVKNGIGIANMTRRTKLFYGSFSIESSLGKGSTVLVDIPLDKEVEPELVA